MQLPLLERFRGALLAAELGCASDRQAPHAIARSPLLHSLPEFLRDRLLQTGTLPDNLDLTPFPRRLCLSLLLGLWYCDRPDALVAQPSALQPVAFCVAWATRDDTSARSLRSRLPELAERCPDFAAELATLQARLDASVARLPEPETPLVAALNAVLCGNLGGVWRSTSPLSETQREIGGIAGALWGASRSRLGLSARDRQRLSPDLRYALDALAWDAWQGWAGRLDFQPWTTDAADETVLDAAGRLRARPLSRPR